MLLIEVINFGTLDFNVIIKSNNNHRQKFMKGRFVAEIIDLEIIIIQEVRIIIIYNLIRIDCWANACKNLSI